MTSQFEPIRSFAQSRIETIKKIPVSPEVDEARLFELNLIVTLCEGLDKQMELINAAAFGVRAQAV